MEWLSDSQALMLAALILAVAVLYSSVGHGGASGYIASMALIGLAPEVMRPAALLLNVAVASLGSWRFARGGYFSWRNFAPFALASIPCAYLGGLVHLSAPVYRMCIGLVLLYAAAQVALSARIASRADAATRQAAIPWTFGLLTGGIIGVISGITGVGGGIFLSPLLLLLGWASTRHTAGLSAPFIVVNSIAGLIALKHPFATLPPTWPLWAIAAVGGGFLGTYLGVRRIPVGILRGLLALVLLIGALKMLLT